MNDENCDILSMLWLRDKQRNSSNERTQLIQHKLAEHNSTQP